MIFNLLRNKIVLILLPILGFIFISLLVSNKIQQDAQVLGYSSDRCKSKFDLNCDIKINFQDALIFKEYIFSASSKVIEKIPTVNKSKTKSDPTPETTTTTEPSKTKPNPTPTPNPDPEPTPDPDPEPDPTPEPDTSGNPYPGAPACSHTTDEFHKLWDEQNRCHYDHEHGENPFTSEVSNVFPRSILGQSLKEMLGNVEVGHTNPSSSMENAHAAHQHSGPRGKHGGFKWQVQTNTPNGCVLGFEDAGVAINALAVQYHAFGDYDVEFEARVHSTVALLRQCLPDSTDYGYIYTTQHVDYGQRVSAYQGDIVPYPDNPSPSYGDSFAPYFTVDCIGRSAPPCGRYTSYEHYVSSNGNASTTWTSKSPQRLGTSGSSLFQLLFRARDTYQILDFSDNSYPFSYMWLCSRDGGNTYSAYPGCRHNNSTTRVHEIGGVIPQGWDNLAGFDTNPQVGRITASGYTTKFGTLSTSCTAVGTNCHPLKLVNAYVGRYGSLLFRDKIQAFSLETLPERDIYFCNGVVCTETSSGAKSSGWIGPNN